jgi:hypothetical protein
MIYYGLLIKQLFYYYFTIILLLFYNYFTIILLLKNELASYLAEKNI